MFKRSPLLNYITYKGRLGRKQFFFYHIVLVVFILFMLDISLTIDRNSLVSALMIFGPITAAGSLLFMMRRFHDLNYPGWLGLIIYCMNFISGHFSRDYPILIWIIALPSVIVTLLLFFKKGTPGPNQYGPDPTVKIDKKHLKKPAVKDLYPPKTMDAETTVINEEKHTSLPQEDSNPNSDKK